MERNGPELWASYLQSPARKWFEEELEKLRTGASTGVKGANTGPGVVAEEWTDDRWWRQRHGHGKERPQKRPSSVSPRWVFHRISTTVAVLPPSLHPGESFSLRLEGVADLVRVTFPEDGTPGQSYEFTLKPPVQQRVLSSQLKPGEPSVPLPCGDDGYFLPRRPLLDTLKHRVPTATEAEIMRAEMQKQTGLQHADVSGGLEVFPVPVVNTVDDTTFDLTSFRYVRTPEIPPEIQKCIDQAPSQGCQCTGSCGGVGREGALGPRCSCVDAFGDVFDLVIKLRITSLPDGEKPTFSWAPAVGLPSGAGVSGVPRAVKGRKEGSSAWEAYPSMSQASKDCDVDYNDVLNCCRGVVESADGYEFQYDLDASEPEPADDEGAAGEASGSDDGDAMDGDWKAPAKASLPAAKKPKLERQLPDRHLSTEELEEWTQLVLRCAKALGRSANNLPVYTSESSIALQVGAIGGEAAAKILALSKKEQEEESELDDEEKTYIVETLDDGRQSTALFNQNGAKAALAVVKYIAGAGVKLNNNNGGGRPRLSAGAKGRGRGRGRPRGRGRAAGEARGPQAVITEELECGRLLAAAVAEALGVDISTIRSDDGSTARLDSMASIQYTTQQDDETPRQIASLFGVAVGDVLAASRQWYPELQSNTRLRPQTFIRLPTKQKGLAIGGYGVLVVCGTKLGPTEAQERLRELSTEGAGKWSVSSVTATRYGSYEQNRLGLLQSFSVIHECTDKCGCAPLSTDAPDGCGNRVLQRGIRPDVLLEVFRAGPDKGWGLRSRSFIATGTFVCEYVGELLTDTESNVRGKEKGDEYLFDLDLSAQRRADRAARGGAEAARDDGGDEEEEFAIDAKHVGGAARFINHSCQPNLMVQNVLVGHTDERLTRVAFFASQDIDAMEELSFDYGETTSGTHRVCRCGAKKCRGKLQ